MRVALFTETFLPNVDGVVNSLCRTIDELQKRGSAIQLFAPEGSVRSYRGLRVNLLPAQPFVLYPQIRLAALTTDVSPELSRFKPDLVHVLNPIACGLAGMGAARRLNLPLVASYHTDIASYAERYGFGIFQDAVRRFNAFIYNQADLSLAPTPTIAQELRTHGVERVRVWGRGVDTQLFHPKRRFSLMRRFLSQGKPESPIALYVGRLAHEKRVDLLRALFDQIPDLRLAIVGDGPARKELEAHFSGTHTRFTGMLRGRRLARAYASAELFICPSPTETFGNVILEAMASGTPVLAAAAGGPLDLIQSGENGLLFERDNARDLGEKGALLLSHRALAESLAQEARVTARARRWSAVTAGLEGNYAAAIRLQRRGRNRLAQRVLPAPFREMLGRLGVN